MGLVAASKYRGLAYACQQLLIKLAGERALSRYGGLGRDARIAMKDRIDDLVELYEKEVGAKEVPGVVLRPMMGVEDLPVGERPLYAFAQTCVDPKGRSDGRTNK